MGTTGRPEPDPSTGDVVLRRIGIVRNGVTRPRLNGWHGVESRILVAPAYAPALLGLDGFSHAIVLTWLHLAAIESLDRLAIHPGGDDRLPLVGLFALRVPARPSPIGVSVVRVLGIDGADLRVRGLDAVDGTPVLDLKPYLPPYDSVPDASLPDWAAGR